MKKLQKNNKGFSLVELIIVIAIMAVLMTVLAPQFLRYVERSRLQSDNTAIGEIANACKVSLTDEVIATGVGAADITITIAATTPAPLTITGGNAAAITALTTEMTNTVGNVALTSNTYTAAGATPVSIVLHLNATTNVLEVQGVGYVPEVEGTPTTAAAPRIF